MSLAKPRMHTNDRLLIRVPVVFALGGLELAKLLCGNAYDHRPKLYDRPPVPGKDMTKAELEKYVRDALWAIGNSAFEDESFGEGESMADCNVHVIWAAGQIRRLHPELVDKAFEDWVGFWQAEADKEPERRRALLGGRD